jgi:hypothetical protein
VTPLGEALTVSAVGAALAGVAGSLVGATVPAALVGGTNGFLSGHRGIYDWRHRSGVGAFVLDSTWALGTTFSGLVAHGVGAIRGDAGFDASLSRRQNRHVYARGFQPRRGFATTLGNVVNGAGDLRVARRAKLVTDHENVHVWQARGFGPLYPVLYLGWAAGGAIGGVVLWAVRRGDEPIGKLVEAFAYYLNPFEYWAYSRDDHWPPRGLVAGLGPKRPIVRSFAATR